MEWKDLLFWNTKENPAQARIAEEAGGYISTDAVITYQQGFEKLESVNRGTSMIVNACASLDYDVKNKTITQSISPGMKQKSLLNLLNFRPNPYQSAQEFRVQIFTDFILEGNIFLYWDGVFLYHLPAIKMTVFPDDKKFVKGYEYNRVTPFKPEEIIHIKDLSSSSVFRGSSRLESAVRSTNTLYKMQAFQDSFFANGAVAGIVIETDNTLSQVAKDRTVANWRQNYSVTNGGRKPILLDSGMKMHSIGDTNFKEMDFDTSINTHNIKVYTALGIPPILMEGGNNANISPNLRLFYLETVMPIARKFTSALERFFGYDVEVVTANVSALQPDIKDIASYLVQMVNGGILTPDEARVEIRYEPKGGDSDNIRVPANIAGSAVDPGKGGAPPKPKTADEPKP